MNTRELSPALLGSAALHLGVGILLLFSWQRTRDLKIGTVVPVTIVSDAPAAELSPALEAPEVQTAQAETPVPEAAPTPLPPAPTPAPTPKPEPPKPAPVAPPKPALPKPAPSKPEPKPEKSLDLDALAASVSKMAKASGAKSSPAAKGPPRPETAPQGRTGQGSAVAAAALSGFVDDLQRRWNPNCGVAGGRDVLVRATFQVGPSGQLMGGVATQASGATPPVNQAAATRAISAVQAAAPFRNLPREYYGQRVAVNFIAREACS